MALEGDGDQDVPRPSCDASVSLSSRYRGDGQHELAENAGWRSKGGAAVNSVPRR